jgi:hypothetical protein
MERIITKYQALDEYAAALQDVKETATRVQEAGATSERAEVEVFDANRAYNQACDAARRALAQFDQVLVPHVAESAQMAAAKMRGRF